MISVKASKASKKHPNPTLTLMVSVAKTAAHGPVDITITETGGVTTVTGAFAIT